MVESLSSSPAQKEPRGAQKLCGRGHGTRAPVAFPVFTSAAGLTPSGGLCPVSAQGGMVASIRLRLCAAKT